MKNIKLLLFIIPLFFLSGCLDMGDDKTEYVSGWHNNIICTSFEIDNTSAWEETHSTVNPYFAALPFNNITYNNYRAKGYIPTFPFSDATLSKPVKNQWIQIYYNGKTVYVQWEDVGPWFVEDYEYVFDMTGVTRPRAEKFIGQQVNRHGTYSEQGLIAPAFSRSACNGAGIDISPAAMKYLTGKESNNIRVRWRFCLPEEALIADPLQLYWASKVNQ